MSAILEATFEQQKRMLSTNGFTQGSLGADVPLDVIDQINGVIARTNIEASQLLKTPCAEIFLDTEISDPELYAYTAIILNDRDEECPAIFTNPLRLRQQAILLRDNPNKEGPFIRESTRLYVSHEAYHVRDAYRLIALSRSNPEMAVNQGQEFEDPWIGDRKELAADLFAIRRYMRTRETVNEQDARDKQLGLKLGRIVLNYHLHSRKE